MRILHYIDLFDFDWGGIVQYVHQLCSKLSERGVPVTLVAGLNKDIPIEWLEGKTGSPTAYVLNSPPGKQSWLSRQQLQQIESWLTGHDVVHLHGAWDLGNIRLGRLLKQLDIPYVASSHGMLDDWSLREKRLKKSIFLKLFCNRYFQDATVVHCTAAAESHQVQANLKNIGTPVCVPPFVQPIDPQSADPALAYQDFPDLDQHRPKILFLSRLHYKKGPEYLIDAIAELNRSGRNCQLIMAGPGEADYLDQLKSRACQAGVDADLVWTGMVREPLKSSLYVASDVFVLPTQQENFGIVLAEALSAGVPIVTTIGTDIHCELQQAGALISDLSGSELADKIGQILDDPDPDKRRQRGISYFHDWLDEDRVIQQHLEMYQTATSMKEGP